MIPPLGKLFPADPPAKWPAFAAALEDDEKTRQMRELIKANAWPVVICAAPLLLLTMVAALCLAVAMR